MLLDLSNLLMDNGQGRAAIACLKRMISIEPDNVSGWQNLAVAQFMRGQYDDGIDSCEEALRREPQNVLTLFNLALANEHDRPLRQGVCNGSAAAWKSSRATSVSRS